MAKYNLPTFPAKGQRQKLDREWLTLLAAEGASGFLTGELVPPDLLGLAVEQFNRGRYWQCHETLEELWLPEGYPLRLFYHGLIKVAVGLLHLERRNRLGAEAKLGEGLGALEPFLPGFMGVDLALLRQEVGQRLRCITGQGEARWADVEGQPRVLIRRLDVPEAPTGRR